MRITLLKSLIYTETRQPALHGMDVRWRFTIITEDTTVRANIMMRQVMCIIMIMRQITIGSIMFSCTIFISSLRM